MRHLLRPVATLAAGVLVATTLTSSPAHAGPDDRGAQWLESQLTGGVVHNDQYGFDDLGLTVDFGLAFHEIGRTGARDAVRDAMSSRADAYTAPSPEEVYAGSTAKLIVFAQAAGADPRSYGNTDLVSRLHGRINTERPNVGRIQDQTPWGDFANTIGQAFAARGLARARSGKADEVIRFLLKQQCDAGFFRLAFADPTASRQTCDAASAEDRVPDTDVTALAVLNLRALPKAERTRATRTAVADAVRWLKRTQKRNGSFGGGDVTTAASNANSTGLAAWALGESGACGAALEAARWVRELQVRGDVTGTPLEGESGAIAYSRAAMTAGETSGIPVSERDQWRRTTAQAAPGLAFVSGC